MMRRPIFLFFPSSTFSNVFSSLTYLFHHAPSFTPLSASLPDLHNLLISPSLDGGCGTPSLLTVGYHTYLLPKLCILRYIRSSWKRGSPYYHCRKRKGVWPCPRFSSFFFLFSLLFPNLRLDTIQRTTGGGYSIYIPGSGFLQGRECLLLLRKCFEGSNKTRGLLSFYTTRYQYIYN